MLEWKEWVITIQLLSILTLIKEAGRPRKGMA